jgi:hypothetical protein
LSKAWASTTGAGSILHPVRFEAMKWGPAYLHGKDAVSSAAKPKRL